LKEYRFMKNTKSLLAILVCGTMVFACSKKEEDKAPKTEPTTAPVEAPKTVEPAEPVAPEEPASTNNTETAPFAAVIVHKVKDFAKWKVGFDAHAEHRKTAGVMGHHLSQGADDPNMVAVYMPMATTEKFDEMVKSEDMKKAMMEAGVEGKPEIHMMKPVENNVVLDRDTAGLVVMAEVEDYAAWKVVFDEGSEMAKKAGLIGHAINQDIKDPNKLTVLMQAESTEVLTAFWASDEVKAAIKKSGVKGEPKTMMLKSTAAEMY